MNHEFCFKQAIFKKTVNKKAIVFNWLILTDIAAVNFVFIMSFCKWVQVCDW